MPFKLLNLNFWPQSIPDATPTQAGVMSPADKSKLDACCSIGGPPTVELDIGAGGTESGKSGSIQNATPNQSAQLVVTTGTAPISANAIVASVTFNPELDHIPIVSLTPGNAAAAALSGNQQVYVNVSVDVGFSVMSGSSALSPTTQYIWNFQIA